MSNPNFELWLLMHFPNINQYNPQMLLENKKNLRHQLFKNVSTSRRYLEILVSQNAEGYSKGKKLRFERFLPFVEGMKVKKILKLPDTIMESKPLNYGWA